MTGIYEQQVKAFQTIGDALNNIATALIAVANKTTVASAGGFPVVETKEQGVAEKPTRGRKPKAAPAVVSETAGEPIDDDLSDFLGDDPEVKQSDLDRDEVLKRMRGAVQKYGQEPMKDIIAKIKAKFPEVKELKDIVTQQQLRFMLDEVVAFEKARG